MQIDTYTDHLKGAIQAAQSLAQRKVHQRLTPLHLLKALLDETVPVSVLNGQLAVRGASLAQAA